MPSPRVRLLEVDPDLGSFLNSEELVEARQLSLAVVTAERGGEDLAQYRGAGGFGALVLEGLVFRQLQIADQTGMRLIGPGEILSLGEPPAPAPVSASSFSAVPGTRLALLGEELLVAARRWPGLIAALQLRTVQQADRLTAQLVICQLPRVDQRLLSLFWLLAESWGRVTPAGIRLPLKLTHETLGALIGARRPTVTLALRELTDRGAVIRQDEGWLVLEPPPGVTASRPIPQIAAPLESTSESWAQHPDRGRWTDAALGAAPAAENSYATLKESFDELRATHVQNRDDFVERMRTLMLQREHFRESRTRIARERISVRRHSPSS